MTLRTTILLLAVLLAQPVWAAREYFNVVNAPFDTISNGPQNAIIVDVANRDDPAAVNAAVDGALGRIATRSARNPLSFQIAKLREAGLIRQDVNSFYDVLVLVRSGGVLEPQTRATRAYGGGQITFSYSGWDPTTEARLRQFQTIAYPIVESIYGKPANTIGVTVMSDSQQTVRDQFLGGAYVIGTGNTRQIRLYPTPSGQIMDLERMLLFSMIRAFHDTAAFHYDAWEEGFKRAAAVAAGELIDREIAKIPSSGLFELDLTEDALSYLMANYEALNQPPLSNNTFITSWTSVLENLDGFGGMFIPRLGMSSTAWLKVYIERLRTDGQSFFRLFNEAYYTQLAANSGLPGNVPSLRSIVSGVTSSVEGQTFDEWFRRQYVFDTSISIGRKLYAFTFPADTPANPDDLGYSVPTLLIYYSTTATGDETPLSTTVYPVYWDYKYATDLFLAGQYEMFAINSGEGSESPTFFVDNFGGPQRVAMDFTAGTETARVNFPAGMAGTEASPNNFTGTIIGADGGTLSVKVDSAANVPVTITKGAFGRILSTLVGFHRVTMTYTSTTGSVITKVANVGTGGYQAIMNVPAATSSVIHTFTPGIRMMSVPMTTFQQDQRLALEDGSGNPAFPAGKLLLARWNPSLADAYKYEMYPKTPPFAPGRAYWMKTTSTVNVTVKGQSPDPASDWRIGLVNGWNQIGAPFASSVSITTLMVEKGNEEPMTFTEAWSRGYVGKVIWKYSPSAGYAQATALDPWEGYWIKCNVPEGVVLTVPGPTSRSRSASRAASTGASSTGSKGSWSMTLSALSPSGEASSVTLGVAPGATDGFDNAYDAESPPPYESSISLAAAIPGRAADACAVDTRSASSGKVSWDVVVTPKAENEDVVVRWQDITAVPKDYKLTVLDHSTGRSRFMRTSSNYRFNSGDGSPRRLTITADASPNNRLLISNVAVSPTRGSSVSFTYNVSTEAQVSAEIVGATGRKIRRLESGRATRSGINNMTWDRRDDQGRAVPAGAYLLQLTAVTEEGEMVKSVRPVLLAR